MFGRCKMLDIGSVAIFAFLHRKSNETQLRSKSGTQLERCSIKNQSRVEGEEERSR